MSELSPEEAPEEILAVAPELAFKIAQRFIARAAALHPSLAGEVLVSDRTEPGYIVAGIDNGRAIGELYDYWREHFPEGGEPYWSVRSWTMLVWQPAFLAIAAVHGAGLPIDLQRLQQKRSGGVLAGFRLPVAALVSDLATDLTPGPVPGTASEIAPVLEDALIRTTGRALRMLVDELFAQLTGVVRLKPLSANRLLADSLLSALSRLEQLQPRVGNSRILALAERWLHAAGLAGESALVTLPLRGGRTALVLDRKGCCMHYRRQDGDLCSSCPKLKRPERLRRMQEELEHEADAG